MDLPDLSFITEASDDNYSKNGLSRQTNIINLQQDLIGMFQENAKLQKTIRNHESKKNLTKITQTFLDKEQQTNPYDKDQDKHIEQLQKQLKEMNNLYEIDQFLLQQSTNDDDQEQQKLREDLQKLQEDFQILQQECEQQSDLIKEQFEEQEQINELLQEQKTHLKEQQQLIYQLQVLWDDEKFSNSQLHKVILKFEEDFQAQQLTHKNLVIKSDELQGTLNQYHLDVRVYECDYSEKSKEISQLQSQNSLIQCEYENTWNKLRSNEKDLQQKEQQIKSLTKNQTTQQMLLKEIVEQQIASEERLNLEELIEKLKSQIEQDSNEIKFISAKLNLSLKGQDQSLKEQCQLTSQINDLKEELDNQQMKYQLLKEELGESIELLLEKSKTKPKCSRHTETEDLTYSTSILQNHQISSDYEIVQNNLRQVEIDLLQKEQQILTLTKNQATQQMLIKEYFDELQISSRTIQSLQDKINNQAQTPQFNYITDRESVVFPEEQHRDVQSYISSEIQDFQKKEIEDYKINIQQDSDQAFQINEKLIMSLKEQEIITKQLKEKDLITKQLNQQINDLREELDNQQMKYELLQGELGASIEHLITRTKINPTVSKQTETEIGEAYPSEIIPQIHITTFTKDAANQTQLVKGVNKQYMNSESQTDILDNNPAKKNLFETQRLKDELKLLKKQHQDALESYYFFQVENKKLNETIIQMSRSNQYSQSNQTNISDILNDKITIQIQKSKPQEYTTPGSKTQGSRTQISKTQGSKTQDYVNKAESYSMLGTNEPQLVKQKESDSQSSQSQYQLLNQQLEACQNEILQLKQIISKLQIQQNDDKEKLEYQTKLIEQLQSSQQITLLEVSQKELQMNQLKVSELEEKLMKTTQELSQKSMDFSRMKNVNNFLHRDLEKLKNQEESKQKID